MTLAKTTAIQRPRDRTLGWRVTALVVSLACLGCPPQYDPTLPVTPTGEGPPGDVLDVSLTPRVGRPAGVSAFTKPAMKPDRLLPAPHGATQREGLPPGPQQWSVLRVGDPVNVIPFVIVGEGSTAALYLDTDQDGDVGDETPIPNASNADNFATRLEVPVRYAESTQPLHVWLYTNTKRGLYDFYSVGCREGKLIVGGPFALYAFEEECDGNYADHPVGIDVNGDGELQASERVAVGESIRLNGVAVTLRSVAADGSRVVFSRATHDAEPRDVGEDVKAELTVKPFRFTDLEGNEVAVGDETRGKVVLLDFWATWCGPCMQEMPNVKALHTRLLEREDFLLVGISLDSDRQKLTEVVAEQNLSWSHYFDGEGLEGLVPQAYGVTGIPATFLIDREGRIVAKGLRGEALGKRIDEVLGEAR